jgi:hypothetical protein
MSTTPPPAYDTVHPLNMELSFAHQLRMDVWSRHLRAECWQVQDPIASIAYWRRDPVFHNVAPYNHHEYDHFDLDDPRVLAIVQALSASPLVSGVGAQNLYDALWDNAFDPGRKVP